LTLSLLLTEGAKLLSVGFVLTVLTD